MSLIKTPLEIDWMREGGHILSESLRVAVEAVKPGVTLREIDAIGEARMRELGATPSFKGYKTNPKDTPFPSTICLSVNDEIVHGLGNRDLKLKKGDVLGLDIGCWYKGLCTDMAVSVCVGGNASPEIQALLDVTKGSTLAGVRAAKVGGTVHDISRAVEDFVKPHGYGIVRALVGHGVGHEVHESPNVPNFYSKQYPRVELLDGMCLAIEPMLSLSGEYKVDTGADGWSIVMADGSIGSHFEVTIAITKKGVEILTPLPI